MRGVDQFGMPIRRTTRKKIKKPSNVMFKLRDPVTGLFWTMPSDAKNPVFSHMGKQWGSRQGAMANWAEYNFTRIVADDQHPRQLELVEFEVKVTEKNSSASNSPDMTIPALFAITCEDAVLNKFVKNITMDGYVFSHVIKCEKNGELELPEHISCRRQSCLSLNTNYAFFPVKVTIHNALSVGGGAPRGINQSQTKKREDPHYIAVGTETDMIYLKMDLSEYVVGIWDVAKLIAGEETGQ